MILRSRASQALPACQSLACKAQRTGQERLLQLRQAASRRSTLTGAKCTTMLDLWLSMSLLLLQFSDLSMAPFVEFAACFSASSALMLPCKTLDLRRAGRNPRFGQSATSTLAPGTEASMTCSSSSQPASASGEGHGPDAAAAWVLLMAQHPATVISGACWSFGCAAAKPARQKTLPWACSKVYSPTQEPLARVGKGIGSQPAKTCRR